MAFLKVSGINKRLSLSFSLSDIHFTQEQGQKIAITGETGSGKSTLLRIIAGLVQADKGTVLLAGEKVIGPDDQLIPGHPGIAYLSQDHELRNNYRIEELLGYANKLPVAEAERLYRICRIEHLMKRKNVQLSGGEKQRVALARLLVGAPRLLLLDEPFSNLDLIHKKILKSVIEEIHLELNTNCILTSHDPADTLSWADELIVMRNGSIIQQGHPEKVFSFPDSEYTAGLFGTYTLLDAEKAATIGINVPRNRQVLLRPHHISITPETTGIKAIITGLVFSGASYEITVSTGGIILNTQSIARGWKLGQSVYIVIDPDQGYIIN